ncbi:hypothetical protein SSYIS1_10140 [Serratia symbiotica]|uniref:Uncharacterized protein n=1 Tax=Serratia symbiotica TaxID=138074 RepID=A0A455VEX8_9GAMM|nr:hypothetical protein SSYIS1_10140 [Serratia symbiotica]
MSLLGFVASLLDGMEPMKSVFLPLIAITYVSPENMINKVK